MAETKFLCLILLMFELMLQLKYCCIVCRSVKILGSNVGITASLFVATLRVVL